jgi:hypothetical protein
VNHWFNGLPSRSWLRYHALGFSTRKVNPNLGIETREFSELELEIYNPICKDETKTCATSKVRPYQWAAKRHTACKSAHLASLDQLAARFSNCQQK